MIKISSFNQMIAYCIYCILIFCSPAVLANNTNTYSGIDDDLCNEMKAKNVISVGAPVPCDRLRRVRFAFYDFEGKLHDDGEIIVMDAVADYVLNIFETLAEKRFPIERARGVRHYFGDDEASMADNNTSAFNYRKIAGSSSISVHAYGVAIDINPVQNPLIKTKNGKTATSPEAGRKYVDRKQLHPGMAEAVVDIFASNGFVIWGGNWTSPMDFQHFQLPRALARHLASLPFSEARKSFALFVSDYRACRKGVSGDPKDALEKCVN